MRIVYDIGDRIKDIKNDKRRGIVQNFFTSAGRLKYTVLKTDGSYALILHDDAVPDMVKGLHEKCPKCGEEYGLRGPSTRLKS